MRLFTLGVIAIPAFLQSGFISFFSSIFKMGVNRYASTKPSIIGMAMVMNLSMPPMKLERWNRI